MAKSIKAASVVVTLEAQSAKFTETMERVKQQTHNSTNAMIKSLAGVQAATAQWANTTTQLFAQPFLAFKKAIAPFQIACSQIIQIASNLIHPFKNLVQYVSGPFINGLQRGLAVARNALTTFSIAGAAALGALTFLGIGVMENAKTIGRWSAIMGIGKERLNEFSYAARSAGMDLDQVMDGVLQIQQRISDTAKHGGAMLDFFQNLTQGSKKAAQEEAIRWTKNMDAIEQYETYMDRIVQLQKNGESNYAAFLLDDLGDSGRDLYGYMVMTGKTMKDIKEDAKQAGMSIYNNSGLIQMSAMLGGIGIKFQNIASNIMDALAGPITETFQYYDKKFNTLINEKGGGIILKGYEILSLEIAGEILKGSIVVIDGFKQMFSTVGTIIDGIKEVIESYTSVKFQKTVNPLAQLEGFGESKRLGELDKKQNRTAAEEEERKNIMTLREQRELYAQQNKHLNEINSYKGNKEAWAEYAKNNNLMETKTVRGYDPKKSWTETTVQQPIAYDKYKEKSQKDRDSTVDKLNTAYDRTKGVDSGGLTDSLNAGYKAVQVKLKAALKKTAKDYDTNTKPSGTGSFTNGSSQLDEADKISAAAKKNKEALESAHRQREAVLESLGLGPTSSEYERTLGDKKRQIEEAFEKEIQAETDLHGAQSANIQKLKAEREKAILDMSKLEKVKYDEQVSYFNKYKQLDTQSLLHKLGMYSGVTDAELEYQEQIRQGHDDIERWFREREENTLALYGRDSEEYKNLLEEKKKMDDEFTEYAQANIKKRSEYSEAMNRGEVSQVYAATQDFKGSMEERESVIKGFKNSELDGGLDERIKEKQKDGKDLTGKEVEQVKRAEDKKVQIMAAGAEQMLATMATKNKKAFEAQKALRIAMATMDMFAGAQKALAESSPWMAAGMMAMVIAMGTMNIAQIASQKYTGMAHDGIDNIPREGTWLLDGGERVVDKRTNGDLKQYLAEKNSNPSQGQNVSYAPVNHFNTSVNEDDILRLLAKQPDKFKQVLLRGY